MSDLRERVISYNKEIKAALQAVYSDLNQGQRKKLLRNPTICAMFEQYGGGDRQKINRNEETNGRNYYNAKIMMIEHKLSNFNPIILIIKI